MAKIKGDVAFINAPNYVNNQAAEIIALECSELIASGTVKLVLDLSEAKLVNSVGIAIIIEIIEKAIEKGGSFGFCNVSPTIEKTFKIMGLTQLAQIYPDQDVAVGQQE